MRLFFAIELPDAVRSAALAQQDRLKACAGGNEFRWERPENFHITLKFLGETSPERLAEVVEAGRAAASSVPRFSAALGPPGAFPSLRRPKILWAGVREGIPELTRVAEYLDSRLAKNGFPGESRPFHPHITLARMKARQFGARSSTSASIELESIVEKIRWEKEKVDKMAVFKVHHIVLISSELRPAGAEYTVQARFELAAV